MNVLLIHPQFPDTFWSYSHALRFIARKAALPPLGLLTVAAMLPPAWGKRLADLNVAPLSDADLAWADCVFVGGMTVQRHQARQVIARCKAAGKRVVAGGPLFTGEYALFEQVDHFVLNEAELTLAGLVADLERGCAKRMYRSREFADMTQSPVPAWGLVDLGQYACASVQFSRGCPYECEFCNVTQLLGRRPRAKTPEQIIAELDALHALGWRGPVFFVDDNLIGHRPALRALLPALKRWQQERGPISFFTQLSINLADDPALTRELVEAGFGMVFVGIETPDEENLVECKKGQNRNRDLVGDVRRLQRAGLEVQGGFIVGFDHDTPATFQRQVDFIERSGIATAMVGMLHAPPGTKLAQRLWMQGRLVGPSSGDNTDGSTNIVPTMGLEPLRRGYGWMLDRLYSPRAFYRRAKAFLREYRRPNVSSPLDLPRVQAFLRTVVHLGVVGPERIEYWALLGWTLLHRPSLFPMAVRLAVFGRHYRRICELRSVSGAAEAVAGPGVSHAVERAAVS